MKSYKNPYMEALTWSMNATGLEPTTWKLLVRGLCARVNGERGDFDVWPSHRQMAEDCEISEASVKRHLRELVKKRFIKVVPQQRDNGASSSNVYRIMIKSEHHMPDHKVSIDADQVGGQSDPLPQVNLTPRGGQSDPPGGVTGDPRIGTTEEGNDSIERESGDELSKDLFGQPLLTPEEAIEHEDQALVDRVVQAWHLLAEQNPIVPDIREVGEKRRKAILKRSEITTRADREKLWADVFEQIAASRFLRGLNPPTRDQAEPFSCRFDWLMKAENFTKVLEGNYRDKRADHDGFDPSGRRLTAIEQGGRKVDERIRAGRERLLEGADPGGDQPAGPRRPLRRIVGSAGFNPANR